ncbi:DUF5689 domain-containing protein [Chryseobacterium koreense]|uniref:DUF5689 domain-containing protein n=1 Tax=Chryseobacterium koreense CCUG 49689 TaxID=1304281 RepID=A0A0J7LT02_9FLAO|nr:DUF5689 domain-containing protein [Chryseobacterium koreense]KMQ72085.1 hypothetical protein ACM44_03440 [Chryseobacterium koreense CCUG 49689]MBB5332038.1 hypothetical protein [Chryseobacterium koreense]
MNITKFLKSAFVVAVSAVTLSSCVNKDEWDTPPINCNNKFDAPNISMADFKALAPASGYVLITDDKIFDGYVVSSDENGNFYKTISFQDKPENPTVGLQIEVDKASNYADFPIGTHIRINAKGLRLGLDRGTWKIGSVDPNFAIGRIPSVLLNRYLSAVCNGNAMDVVTIKPRVLTNLAAAKQDIYLNTLVTVPNVQFNFGEIYPVQKAYVDFVGGAGVDTDRNIEDSSGSSTVLRSSGFSTFGATLLPKGSGNLTFVVSKYNANYQMIIRSLDDVKIAASGPRFNPYPPKGGTDITYPQTFLENFESYPSTSAPWFNTFPKYINYNILGIRYWEVRNFSGNKYIQLTANGATTSNNGGTTAVETSFMVPVNFVPGKKLTFDHNFGFDNGKVLKVYTTTDYKVGDDITSATLKDITSSFTFQTGPVSGYGTLAPSGTYTFTESGNGFIVFKYTGVGGGVTTTAQIDNIQVQ